MRLWGPLLLVIVAVALWGGFVRSPVAPEARNERPLPPVEMALLCPPQPGASPWPAFKQSVARSERASGLSMGVSEGARSHWGPQLFDNQLEVSLFDMRSELARHKEVLSNETRYQLSIAVSGRCLKLEKNAVAYAWQSGASFDNALLSMIARIYPDGRVQPLAVVSNERDDPLSVPPGDIELGHLAQGDLVVSFPTCHWVLEGQTWRPYKK